MQALGFHDAQNLRKARELAEGSKDLLDHLALKLDELCIHAAHTGEILEQILELLKERR